MIRSTLARTAALPLALLALAGCNGAQATHHQPEPTTSAAAILRARGPIPAPFWIAREADGMVDAFDLKVHPDGTLSGRSWILTPNDDGSKPSLMRQILTGSYKGNLLTISLSVPNTGVNRTFVCPFTATTLTLVPKDNSAPAIFHLPTSAADLADQAQIRSIAASTWGD